MAAEAPDPKTFKSWEDAFQYAVPAVRRMEQQLRGDISGNRERLRTLVGASYRDLLGTAESIIEMNDQMGHVETYLGSLGRRCNTKTLGKSTSNLSLLDQSTAASGKARYAIASQLAVLRSCPEVLARLLKKGGSVLLAAKILVVSRLLHTKLSEQASIRKYIDTMRARLARLRQKLLSHIDRRLKIPQLSSDELVDTMCAFSLATSSSARDVLRHFHHVRAEAVSAYASLSGQPEGYIVEALQLWIRTLQDTNAIVPRQLSQSLAKLKSTPLFKDPSIWSIKDFDYDLHTRWIGDDLKNFVPYVRHDDLPSSMIVDHLSIWAPKTLDAYLSNVNLLLNSIAESAVVVHLRSKCVKLWISNRRYYLGVGREEIFDRLRKPFRQRLAHLIQTDSRSLEGVSAQIMPIIQDQHQTTSQLSQTLWTSSLGSIDISSGAETFLATVRDNVYGADDALHVAIHSYQQWLVVMNRWASTIKELQHLRWDDSLDDLDEDDDTEERLESLLNTDDPQYLERELSHSLVAAFDLFQATADEVTKNIVNDTSFDRKAAFLLRVLRNVKQNLPSAYANTELASSIVNDLQSTIAGFVVNNVMAKHISGISKAAKGSRVQGRLLWNGVPELPILPSPWIYKLLRSLQLTMANTGTDLWSFAAVAKVKSILRESLILALSTQNHIESITNGDEKVHSSPLAIDHTSEDIQLLNDSGNGPTNPNMVENEYKIQLFFDMTYLAHATSSPVSQESGDTFEDCLNRVESECLLVSTSVMQVKKSAAEYWKRSSLLFALLI
ncbi:hypothetical protein MMC17_008254 [Xylographa soralifera]|nr:hypothetical protein [Xylographa soralifera]